MKIDRDEARRLASAGMTRNEIANALGVHPASIWRIASEIGLNVRSVRPKISDEQRESLTPKILEMWDAGMPCLRIANHVGRSRNTVHRVLRENGREYVPRPAKGASSPLWRGGRIKDGNYIALTLRGDGTDDPIALAMKKGKGSGRVMEHRYVMAMSLGRPLGPGETVHHINGDGTDNRLENLQLRTSNHGPGVVHECGDCGSLNVVAKEIRDD